MSWFALQGFGPKSRVSLVLVLVLTLLAPVAADASGWLWDQDADGIDDRIEEVQSLGLAAAFENFDLIDGRQRFAVFDLGGLLTYGVYVGFDHHPTAADLDMLAAAGVDTGVLHAYHSIDYVRMELTFPEIATVAALPGVTRVESIPLLYPLNDNATRTSGITPSFFERFPTVQGDLGITGSGVVVSILDTGVNDQSLLFGLYPGHESFAGKFIAGGNFFAGQPLLNTGLDASENPFDFGEAASSNHGTHVAGTTLGTGGASGTFGGVAPGALLVDQKVLSDAGVGFGSADGVDWAVYNKDRYGIRILNLSLGGVDASDGSDAGSQAINAAFDAGILAAIATGNDGATNHISSPAAADKSVAVGSYADQNTVDRSDDVISSFSNEGPRTDDGDADDVDEMKPLVAAPGSDILSADGSLLTGGNSYKNLSGTSMATPHVAGVMALILDANPGLTPPQVVAILQHTSEHRNAWGKTAAGANPFPQEDPNYHPSGGWGQVDAYAAVKEALRLAGDPTSQTQVVAISADADAGSSTITVRWTSQREIDLLGYEVFRAPDLGGVPGTFTQVNGATIPGTGQAQIEGLANRSLYSFVDAQGLGVGQSYWYQIRHTSSDTAVGTVTEPALLVTLAP
ncbi:MAG: S8 family serine peptidase [Acidobacteriota bacterium]|nr:S8 family serine peptidase [Acidobacteriota bacterium]